MSQETIPTDTVSVDARRPSAWPQSLPFRLWQMRLVRFALVLLLIGAVFSVGRWTARNDGPEFSAPSSEASSAAAKEVVNWTCSMHPQIKLPGPGQCPICFMDLIPVRSEAPEPGELPRLRLSERARTLARVETAEVRRREISYQVRMVGKVAADETRITYISSNVPGRLDRLYVDYTGMLVRKGDHLAEIYSPDLLVAQREYLVAMQSLDNAKARSGDTTGVQAAESLMRAARRKLELWAIPHDQIERLEKERTPSDHIRIDAPSAGWVLDRQGFSGMYVETGTRLFTVADLHRLWVLLDAYELDVAFLHYGQSVEFETESVPGRVFSGQVTYIDPILNEATRTVKVRVNMANADFQLRPGMFVRARVMVHLGAEGRVIGVALAGKWICPMHPEIIKETAAHCDECGMDLVPVESLGYTTSGAIAEPLLAVPQSSVLLTGRRAVVYVEKSSPDGHLFYEGRTVQLGPRADDLYVILSGVREGERVVTRGAVQIDSALQIQAQPSMMQPAADGIGEATTAPSTTASDIQPASHAVAGAAYHAHARPVIAAYLSLTAALAADDLAAARKATVALQQAATTMTPAGLPEAEVSLFTLQGGKLASSVVDRADSSLEELRKSLPPLTTALETYLRTFGHDRDTPLYRLYCPMAMQNRGAYWIGPEPKILNPYFGAAMLRCGEVKGAIAADGKEVR